MIVLDKDINKTKKVTLLKVVAVVAFIFSALYPLVAFLELVSPGSALYNARFDFTSIHNRVLQSFAVINIIHLYLLTKYSHHYRTILISILFFAYITFTSAMIFVPSDPHRGTWFIFLIIVSYFAGDKKYGLVMSSATMITLIAYQLLSAHGFASSVFTTTLMTTLLLIIMIHYFQDIHAQNEKTLYDNNHELFSYKNQLEKMVEEKLAEINSLDEEIIKTQQEVIYTMGTIGETRSKETGNHVRRVAEYSYLLAVYSGIDTEDAKLLRLASPMHDIGKIGIEDSILKKPGKLTDEEFDTMKEHTTIGYDMLKNSTRPIFAISSIVALEHHERFDGKGYPKGLAGEDIHIYGRITALADVFDALGSKRCYKDAWLDDKIFALIKKERGKQFDPNLVDIFFAHLDEFLAIRERFHDVF